MLPNPPNSQSRSAPPSSHFHLQALPQAQTRQPTAEPPADMEDPDNDELPQMPQRKFSN